MQINLDHITRVSDIPLECYFNAEIECKAGNVELIREECAVIERNNLYVCSHTAVYQINFSSAQNKYYAQKVANYKGIAPRGRWYAHNGATIEQITNGAIRLI